MIRQIATALVFMLGMGLLLAGASMPGKTATTCVPVGSWLALCH